MSKEDPTLRKATWVYAIFLIGSFSLGMYYHSKDPKYNFTPQDAVACCSADTCLKEHHHGNK